MLAREAAGCLAGPSAKLLTARRAAGSARKWGVSLPRVDAASAVALKTDNEEKEGNLSPAHGSVTPDAPLGGG